MKSSPIQLNLQIPADQAGQRLDQALARLLPDYSRSRLKTWIESGEIRVDGEIRRPRDKVFGGEAVALDAQLEQEVAAEAQAIPVNLVFEDKHLFVVNKPAGLVVHPGAGNPDRTLQNALLALDPKLADMPRAGIVHRLDKETSGLLIIARTLKAHTALVRMLEEREIHREYEAICKGVMTAGGTIDAPIDRHPTDRVKMAVRQGGRESVTHYRVDQALPREHARARAARDGPHAPDPRAPDARRVSARRRPRLRRPARDAEGSHRRIAGGPARVPAAGAARGEAAARASRERQARRVRRAAAGRHGAVAQGAGPRRRAEMTAHASRWIVPDWPVTARVKVLSTLRTGGVSAGDYASFNLAQHVGDDPAAVAANRALLRQAGGLPSEPLWLDQVHGTGVATHTGENVTPPMADASVAFERGRVCAVMTADCLPVVFTDRGGTRIGVSHAGWRGLAGGVLEATIAALGVPAA